MTKLFKQIGDEVIEYTEADYAQAATDNAATEAKAVAAAEAATDKAALLARLGITADEAKLLLS